MKIISVTMVRIYTLEGSAVLKSVRKYLKEEANVRGMSVFRAVSGFGESGNHSTSFADWSVALPVVIEFFDDPKKISLIIEKLSSIVKSEHIVFYDAKVSL